MGILNVTPDSFSDGGRYVDPAQAVARARQMAIQGADCVDVGGESTRPGAEPVSPQEEMCRILPVIEALASDFPIPISVDTRHADVAEAAIKAGATLINDVTALKGDSRMAEVASRCGVPVILMHMQGDPRTMQKNPSYLDVISDVLGFLQEAAADARAQGVAEEQILIDPGIGFGKRPEHNLALIKHLDRFVESGYPIVVGPSKKSFISAVLNVGPEQRTIGTSAVVAWAATHRVAMVRVHDVLETAQVTRMIGAIQRA